MMVFFCELKSGELKMSPDVREGFRREIERVVLYADGSRDIDISDTLKPHFPGVYKAALVPFTRNGEVEYYVRVESWTDVVVVIVWRQQDTPAFYLCASMADELQAVMGRTTRCLQDTQRVKSIMNSPAANVTASYSRSALGLTVLTESEEEHFIKCSIEKTDLLFPIVSGAATVAKAVMAPLTTATKGNGWIEHWFVVLQTPSQTKLVAHKDFDGNIVVNKCNTWGEAYDKGGFDKKGTHFYKGTVKSCSGKRSLAEVTGWLESQPCKYRLTDCNCQDFAQRFYNWF